MNPTKQGMKIYHNLKTCRLTTSTMKKQRGTRGYLTAQRTRKHKIAYKYPLVIWKQQQKLKSDFFQFSEGWMGIDCF